MKLPTIESGKIILVLSEADTGIILNRDGSRYLDSGNEYFSIFESEVSAAELLTHIARKIGRRIEGIIYDNNGTFLKMIGGGPMGF